jgi:hypothetical protein
MAAGDSGFNAFKHLAPCISPVAIPSQRILKPEDNQVTFRCRISDTGRLRTCTLPTLESIRRFLQHILHKDFARVRCYALACAGGWRHCAGRQHCALSCTIPARRAGTASAGSESVRRDEVPPPRQSLLPIHASTI